MRHCKCTCGHKQYEHDGPRQTCGKCICMYFESQIICTRTYDIALFILAMVSTALILALIAIAGGWNGTL